MNRDKIIILNVNDNEAARYSVTQILQKAGYEMWEAVNGAEALELVKRQPDLVVLDIRLPDISGFEVCRLIKSDPATSTITVVHLSATFIRGEDKARGLEGGADGYLTSPVGQPELVATIRAFVRLRQAENAQRFLGAATAAMTSTLDVEESLQKLARLAVPFLGEWCIIHRFQHEGRLAVVALAGPTEVADAPVRDSDLTRVDTQRLLQHPALLRGVANVIRTRQVELSPPAEAGEPADLSSITLPLIARDRLLGALTLVAAPAERGYGAWKRSVAEELALRAAVCVDNARLYEEAQRAVHTRENFLAVVSHDLKNPLGSIMMANALIADELADEDEAPALRKHTQIIQRSAERMDRLIRDLLDLASIDAGQLSMDRRPTLAAALAFEAREIHAAFAAHKLVTFTTEVDPELPPLLCDKDRIQQVLGNLITNALKFTPQGGAITLRITRAADDDGAADDDLAELSVADTGEGIKSEHIAQLFERFWQASKTGRIGSGLGLSIARGIVVAHGGTIWAESTLGAGSRFAFTLPFAAIEPRP